jgi:mycothiol synthase
MTQPKQTQLLMHRQHLDHDPAVPPLPAGYEVRTANGADDERALAGLLTAAFEEEWTVERVRKELTDAPDVLAVYVVTWQGQPVATASSRTAQDKFPGSGYVHWVGAHPGHARRGLGSILMNRLLQDFQERGYRDAVLETDDFRLPAIKSYLRRGYLPVYDVNGEDHRPRWAAIFPALFASLPAGSPSSAGIAAS